MLYDLFAFLWLVSIALALANKEVQLPDEFKSSKYLNTEHQVFITDNEADYTAAEKWCREEIGGYLPTPKSKEDWAMFHGIVLAVYNSQTIENAVFVWNGATDEATDGIFLDKDGNDVTAFIDWFADGENGNRPDAHYVFCGLAGFIHNQALGGCQEVKADLADTPAHVRGMCYKPQPVNDCEPPPCGNGGICTDEPYAFKCKCAAGFEGDNCETNINECVPNPCANGICTDGVNGFTCKCYQGWSGTTCTQNVPECHWTWVKSGHGSCFKLFHSNGNTYTAQNKCRQQGGELAYTKTWPEWSWFNNWVRNTLMQGWIGQNKNRNIWIGVTKVGGWMWQTKKGPIPLQQAMWETGQPDNTGNCVHYWDRNGAWADAYCSSDLPYYICRKEAFN